MNTPESPAPPTPPRGPGWWLAAAAALFLFCAGLALAVEALVRIDVIHTQDRADAEAGHTRIEAVRARDAALLEGYEALGEGRYRIPIERAMEALAAHPEYLVQLPGSEPPAETP